MNNGDKAFLYACIIGDGHISKRLTKFGTFNYYLSITHCAAQSEYMSYKAQRLNQILNRSVPVREFTNNGYPGVRYTVGNSEVLGPLHDLFYPNGKKKIANLDILSVLNAESLSIWWMDDGSCTSLFRNGKYRGSLGYLSTYEAFEDNELVRTYLNKSFGLSMKSAKSKGRFRMYLNTQDLRKLKPIIEAFVLESMKYKIDVRMKVCIEPLSPVVGDGQ